MLPLHDQLWASMEHRQGSASNLPDILKRLRVSVGSGDEVDEDLMLELSDVCDEWSSYDSTYAVVPHLVDICQNASPESPIRITLLSWIGWCVACLRLNQTEAPEQLVKWFEDSVPKARDLIAQSLPYVDVNEQDDELLTLRSLLAAFATCHGNPALGFVLSELEAGGTQCEECGAFFQPLQSSLNPFHNSDEDNL